MGVVLQVQIMNMYRFLLVETKLGRDAIMKVHIEKMHQVVLAKEMN